MVIFGTGYIFGKKNRLYFNKQVCFYTKTIGTIYQIKSYSLYKKTILLRVLKINFHML